MAQHKKKYRGDPHVRLHNWLLDSDAWLDLSSQARCVYIQLARRYFGTNNGRIGFSVREVEIECRISKNTASSAFNQLIEHGFIEAVTKGGFNRKMRHSTEWLLTEFRNDVTKELPKKSFMKWRQNP
jgi:hypothetical protein